MAWRLRHEPPLVSKRYLLPRTYFYDGQFPANLVNEFVREASGSPEVPFQVEDAAPGYYFNKSTVVPFVETYNRIFSEIRHDLTKIFRHKVSVLTKC